MATTVSDTNGAALSYKLDDASTFTSSYDPTTLSDGAHTVVVRATDGAGNVTDETVSFILDKTAATVASVTANGVGLVAGAGTLTVGQSVTLTLSLSEPVSLSGADDLRLTLSDGGVALYDAAASTTTQLVFTHTVEVDRVSADLAITGVILGTATIRDGAGNAADLSGIVVNPAGTLVIDGYTGTAAAETFRGTTGAETFTGRGGSDTYYVDNVGDRAIEANGAAGTDVVYASVSYSLGGSELENLILTGTGDLTGIGNSVANVITGNAGANVLNGLGGADTMSGGAGSDTYYVDNLGDRVIEANGAAGTDLVYASVSYSLAGSHLENLTLTGTGNLSGTGNGLANVITGNSGANVLNGLIGADTMSGGAGSDTYYVDTAGDRAIEADSAVGTDLVYASVSYSLAGSHLENLTLTGAGNLAGTGNSLANVITGNAGANVLNGGLGADTMSGGAGSDTYYVDNAGDRVLEANGAAGTDLVYASVSYALAGAELEAVPTSSTARAATTS
ncbi:hypothetical protein ASG40_20030 [Methylobacterium sp. Leaf399]|nr:hypothetical protein ASG40_20030 [Methylobacterium sp. Leaf399]